MQTRNSLHLYLIALIIAAIVIPFACVTRCAGAG